MGPDVDPSKSGSFEAQKGGAAPLESTVSEVIDSDEINNLPLGGPRCLHHAGHAAGRHLRRRPRAAGWGFRSTGSGRRRRTFLLDGLENNNYLITGPLDRVAPEAIQEYRVSTNNFSAEYGRTSGFLANAITRSGGNAVSRRRVLLSDERRAERQRLPGEPDRRAARTSTSRTSPVFFVGGPILKNRLFFSSAYRIFSQPQRTGSLHVPVAFAELRIELHRAGIARAAVADAISDAPASDATARGLTHQETLAPPVTVNRTLAIERLDYNTPNGRTA